MAVFMVKDLLRALALVLVIEGILPFAVPSRFRETMQRLSGLDDRVLRVVGLTSMIIGMIALQAVHWLL